MTGRGGGKDTLGGLVVWLSKASRADQPCEANLMLPVGVTTDRGFKTHCKPGITGSMEKD